MAATRRVVRRNKEPRLLHGDRGPGTDPRSGYLLYEPEPQTPSSALRGRRDMDIMELRRLEALRKFSWRLKAWAFIEAGV
jgi:hypothetical protein